MYLDDFKAGDVINGGSLTVDAAAIKEFAGKYDPARRQRVPATRQREVLDHVPGADQRSIGHGAVS